MLALVRFREPMLPLGPSAVSSRATPVSDFRVEGLDAEAAQAALQGRVDRPAGTRVHARREEDGSWTVIFTRPGTPDCQHD